MPRGASEAVGATRAYSGPHGVIHIGCRHARNPRSQAHWYTADSPEDMARELPDYRLYRCSLPKCFGPYAAEDVG